MGKNKGADRGPYEILPVSAVQILDSSRRYGESRAGKRVRMNDIMHRESGATVSVRVASNATGRVIMESTITSVVSNLDLKVLIEYDQDYQIYVARCLDTGAVATGETPEEASKLMKETLELDILLAIRANNLDNLFHVTATPDVKSRWYETIAANPESMESISLNIQQDSPAKRGPRSARIEARIRRSA